MRRSILGVILADSEAVATGTIKKRRFSYEIIFKLHLMSMYSRMSKKNEFVAKGTACNSWVFLGIYSE